MAERTYNFRIAASGFDEFASSLAQIGQQGDAGARAVERLTQASPRLATALQQTQQAAQQAAQAQQDLAQSAGAAETAGGKLADRFTAAAGVLRTVSPAAADAVSAIGGVVSAFEGVATKAAAATSGVSPFVRVITTLSGTLVGVPALLQSMGLGINAAGEAATTAVGATNSYNSALQALNAQLLTTEERAQRAATALRAAEIQRASQTATESLGQSMTRRSQAQQDLMDLDNQIRRAEQRFEEANRRAVTGERPLLPFGNPQNDAAVARRALEELQSRRAAAEREYRERTAEIDDISRRRRQIVPPQWRGTSADPDAPPGAPPPEPLTPFGPDWTPRAASSGGGRGGGGGAQGPERYGDTGYTDAQQRALDRIREQRRKAEEDAAREQARIDERAQEERRRRADRTTDSIVDYASDKFADLFTSQGQSWEKLWENAKKTAIAALARMAAEAALRPIIQPVVYSVYGVDGQPVSGAGAAGAGGGGLGAIGQYAGVAGRIGNFFTGQNAWYNPGYQFNTGIGFADSALNYPLWTNAGAAGSGAGLSSAEAAALADAYGGGAGVFNSAGLTLGQLGTGALGILGGAYGIYSGIQTGGARGVAQGVGGAAGVLGGAAGLVSAGLGGAAGMTAALGAGAAAAIGAIATVAPYIAAIAAVAAMLLPAKEQHVGGVLRIGTGKTGNFGIVGLQGKHIDDWSQAFEATKKQIAQVQSMLEAASLRLNVGPNRTIGNVGVGPAASGEPQTVIAALNKSGGAKLLASDNPNVATALASGQVKTVEEAIGVAQWIAQVYEPLTKTADATKTLDLALSGLNKQFDGAVESAQKYGLSIDGIERERQRQVAALRRTVRDPTGQGGALLEQLTLGDLGGLPSSARVFAGLQLLNRARRDGDVAEYARLAQEVLPIARNYMGTSQRYSRLVNEVASFVSGSDITGGSLTSLLSAQVNGTSRLASTMESLGSAQVGVSQEMLRELRRLTTMLEAQAMRATG